MVYEYSCNSCETRIDIVKPVADFDRIEKCEKCSDTMTRAISASKIHLFGTKVQESRWSPAFGRVVKGDKHEREIAKSKGAIEIGSETPSKHLAPKLHSYDD